MNIPSHYYTYPLTGSPTYTALRCAGEVSLRQDERDYEKWALELKVKFRDEEELQILDRHRQSGGVSRIYLDEGVGKAFVKAGTKRRMLTLEFAA